MNTVEELLDFIRKKDGAKLVESVDDTIPFYEAGTIVIGSGQEIDRRNKFIGFLKNAKYTRADYLLLQDVLDDLEVQKLIRPSADLDKSISNIKFLQGAILDSLGIKVKNNKIIDVELTRLIEQRNSNNYFNALTSADEIRKILNQYKLYLIEQFEKTGVTVELENNRYKLPAQKPEKISDNNWENAQAITKKINKGTELEEILDKPNSYFGENPDAKKLQMFKYKFNEKETQAVLKEPRETFGKKLLDKINGILEKVSISIPFKSRGEKRSAEIQDVLEDAPSAKKMRH